MIKRLILMCMVMLITALSVSAQLWKMKRYEATAELGASQFYGDVGGFTIGENALGFRDITFKQTRFNVSGSFRYFITDEISARISFTYLMVHATDERGTNEIRGYMATTSLYEPALIGEYYFVRNRERNSFLFQTYNRRIRTRMKDLLRSIDVYAFTGIGGAGFNVKGNDRLEEKWDNDPGLKNKGFAIVLPLGIGAKVALDPYILVGFEFEGRYAFSDYLDGYTSQWSGSNDIYHTFNITFNYRIKTARNGLPLFR